MDPVLISVASGLIVDLIKKGVKDSYQALKEAFIDTQLNDDDIADLRSVVKQLPENATVEQVEQHLLKHQGELPFINFGSYAGTVINVSVGTNEKGVVAGTINGPVTIDNTK